MPDRADQRDLAGGSGAHDIFLIEGRQILDRAAAARHDDQIGARNRPASGNGVEAGDGIGDLRGAAFALHRHRPHQHAARETIGKTVKDIANHGAGGAGDDANGTG